MVFIINWGKKKIQKSPIPDNILMSSNMTYRNVTFVFKVADWKMNGNQFNTFNTNVFGIFVK